MTENLSDPIGGSTYLIRTIQSNDFINKCQAGYIEINDNEIIHFLCHDNYLRVNAAGRYGSNFKSVCFGTHCEIALMWMP